MLGCSKFVMRIQRITRRPILSRLRFDPPPGRCRPCRVPADGDRGWAQSHSARVVAPWGFVITLEVVSERLIVLLSNSGLHAPTGKTPESPSWQSTRPTRWTSGRRPWPRELTTTLRRQSRDLRFQQSWPTHPLAWLAEFGQKCMRREPELRMYPRPRPKRLSLTRDGSSRTRCGGQAWARG